MNIVLIAAWGLAVLSMFAVPPDGTYLTYLDGHTLGLLFSLMAVMAGIQRLGLFNYCAGKMLGCVKTSRQLELVLVGVSFLSSMVITNDVALITFVPFSIEALSIAKMKSSIVPVVTFQTVAANLGSMMTPIGNPQNLYLYSKSGEGALHLFLLMLPYGIAAAVLLLIFLLLRKNMSLGILALAPSKPIEGKRRLWMYSGLFLICLMGVGHILPVWFVVAAVLAAVIAADRPTLLKVDYSLLFTFAGFFIFIGNMGRIPAFCGFLEQMAAGNEVAVSMAASQIISNVPAALLLSGFSEHWDALIVGTNLGGLGTLIASMASLISYRFVAGSCPKLKGRYLGFFTGVNVIFMALLFGEYLFVLNL